MLATSMCGSLLLRFASARTIVRIGLLVLLAATLWLITAIGPQLEGGAFAGSMALLGIGLGLLASQLGNTVQSSVRTEERSEAGGLQYTAQNLGSSLGTALIGALLIGALAASVTAKIESDPRVSAAVAQEVGTHVSAGISFVPADQVSAALAARSDVPPQEAAALVEHYRDAQIQGLKSAVLACTVITGGALLFTRHLPAERAAPRPPE